MSCRVFTARSSIWCLRCSNQNYSTSSWKPISNTEDHKNVSSSSAAANNLDQRKIVVVDNIQSTSKDVDEGPGQGIRSMREVKPRELPLSPLMDPVFLEARNRYSAPKPKPSKERTDFQKQLAKNPYALALATPVRQCSATLLSLPSFFLQDFSIMAHPTTSDPWHVPRSLSPRLKSPDKDSSHNPSLGATTYVGLRQSLLQSFLKKGTGYTGIYKKFGLMQAKSVARKRVVLRAVWRSDMDTFILELLRRRTAELLDYLCTKGREYIHECESWERVEYSSKVGCVLWMGQKSTLGEEGASEREQEQEQEIPPGEFETRKIGLRGRIVPVFNLWTMMGKQWVEKMREGNEIFGNQILVLRHKNATKVALMKLWQLQGYVATYGGIPDLTKEKLVKVLKRQRLSASRR
ncbi:hypothetical protein DSL72_007573 [Monilinia vaccinii-corymbosi]|uniref:Uncharacterized protein n=1 Tax=Monilinia vaccinii-corymbosi TaxID=61207 RepID=A0A8A3PHJ5_9HELO|nr:hypothetical protein DSL72_007573 [Monilinia vaccinii-corymbosi]